MDLALVVAALLVGALLAVQAAANLQLSSAVGSAVGASTCNWGWRRCCSPCWRRRPGR